MQLLDFDLSKGEELFSNEIEQNYIWFSLPIEFAKDIFQALDEMLKTIGYELVVAYIRQADYWGIRPIEIGETPEELEKYDKITSRTTLD